MSLGLDKYSFCLDTYQTHLIRDGWFNREDNFFSVSSSQWNHIEILYKIEIVQISAITTEWPYPRKHCWKRLSDFNKIKFYPHLYHCKRKILNKNMIKNISLVLGNKCKIYLFAKEMKKKRDTTDKTFGSLSYRMFSHKKKGNMTWCLKSVSVFKKILFVLRLS